MTRVRADRADLARQRAARAGSVRGRGLARLLARLRDRAFPRRVRTCRQEVSFPRRLGGRSGRSTRAAGLSRPCRGDRRRRPGAAVPAGAGAVALVPQHQLQQYAVEHRPRGPADRAGPSRGAGRARAARRRPHPHRQRQAAASSSMPAPSTACRRGSSSSRGCGRTTPSRRDRHQPLDQRRSRPAAAAAPFSTIPRYGSAREEWKCRRPGGCRIADDVPEQCGSGSRDRDGV